MKNSVVYTVVVCVLLIVSGVIYYYLIYSKSIFQTTYNNVFISTEIETTAPPVADVFTLRGFTDITTSKTVALNRNVTLELTRFVFAPGAYINTSGNRINPNNNALLVSANLTNKSQRHQEIFVNSTNIQKTSFFSIQNKDGMRIDVPNSPASNAYDQLRQIEPLFTLKGLGMVFELEGSVKRDSEMYFVADYPSFNPQKSYIKIKLEDTLFPSK